MKESRRTFQVSDLNRAQRELFISTRVGLKWIECTPPFEYINGINSNRLQFHLGRRFVNPILISDSPIKVTATDLSMLFLFPFSFLLYGKRPRVCVTMWVSVCVCVCVCVCMYTSCQEFIDLWWIILLWRLATFQYIHLCRHGETLLQAMMETSALVWLNAPTRWSQGTSSIFLIDGLLLRRGSRRSPTPPIRLPIRPSTYPPVCLAACNCYI